MLGATQYEVNKNQVLQIAVQMDEIRTKKIFTHIVKYL